MKTMKTFLLGFLLASAAMASAGAAELRVGFVNTARVLEQVPQADAATSSLEREFEPLDRKRKAVQKDLRALEERLQRDAAVLSAVERRKLERNIAAQRRDLKRLEEDFSEELNFRRNEELARIQRDVLRVIQEIGQQEQYDLIIADNAVFVGPRVDLTDKVVQKLRGEYDAKGAGKR